MNKIRSYIFAHKIISTVILVVTLFGGYSIYKKTTSTTGEIRYVLGTVTKGTIISSVSGSGQVSASNQIDIKPKVSGAITYLGIKPGDKVGSGQMLMTIDNTDAQKAVRDAEISLESAKISLSKLKIQNSDVNVSATLAKTYDDGFSTATNTFLDLPGIMSGLNDMFFTSSISKNGQWNIDWYEGQVSSTDTDDVKTYKQSFLDAYNAALLAYNANFNDYKATSRASDNQTLETLIKETYEDVKLISSAIKSANNYIDFVNASIKKTSNSNPPAIIAANLSTLNGYTSKTNSDLQSLLSIETEVQNNKDTVANSTLDTQSQELGITQKENALQDAKDNLLDYSVRAPFSGMITSVPVQKGDTVGSGTAVATLITTDQIATISLNEVDIAKIQLGQKATLTFDAIPDLTISGVVADIDTVGTVSQGVVSYTIKISLDIQDTRIKSGMTVNANIQTKVKQDVLYVPSSVVKTQNGISFVQVFSTPLIESGNNQGTTSAIPPEQVEVVVGISDDTNIEIISGLTEGEQIVTRTISGGTTSKSIPTTTNNTRGASANVIRF